MFNRQAGSVSNMSQDGGGTIFSGQVSVHFCFRDSAAEPYCGCLSGAKLWATSNAPMIRTVRRNTLRMTEV